MGCGVVCSFSQVVGEGRVLKIIKWDNEGRVINAMV